MNTFRNNTKPKRLYSPCLRLPWKALLLGLISSRASFPIELGLWYMSQTQKPLYVFLCLLLLLFVCFIIFLLSCHLSLFNYEFVQVSYVCVSFIHLLVYSLTCIYWAPAYVIEANEFYSFKPNVFFTQGTDKNIPRILEPNTKRIPSRFWASLGINLQHRALKGDYFCMCILALKILGSVGIDSIS